ncbi:MAG: type III glutamate--ammonia ligase [Gammaproteobacteria bacterium]|nr:type III glutamate--ammonia ligase [Gammaproteobacteria bacterium]
MSQTDLKLLQEQLCEQGVKYLIPSYVDMHGVPKTKMVPIAHLEHMMGGSELFTGAALDGVPQDVSDEEVAAHPDPDSCMLVPWRDDCAWFASDLWTEGKPFAPCNRGILKKVLSQAADMGYQVNCGIEAEFYVFADNDNRTEPLSPLPHLEKPAYDTVRLMDNLDIWLADTIDAMNQLGWDVYSFDHEDGIGQFEIDFSYTDALTMADRYVFLRVLAHEMARKHGAYASFMPKPYGDKAGSGAHYNVSLATADGSNLFVADGDDPRGCGLSELGYYFIGGVLKHLPAVQAVSAPTVNSYKRLIVKGSTSGYTWAPCFISYGNNNRTNTVRIPGGGGRVELRSADSACNPYLGIAMMVAAGLEGIRDKIDPGEPHRDNLYYKSDEERMAEGVSWLPRTLDEAVEAFAADPLSRQVFGDVMFDAWLEFKRAEWLSYLNHVSDWERDRYLKFF